MLELALAALILISQAMVREGRTCRAGAFFSVIQISVQNSTILFQVNMTVTLNKIVKMQFM